MRLTLAVLLFLAPREAFDQAAQLERAGRTDEAAGAFEQFSRSYPGDELADDALLEAAQLREERLSDPEGALRLYRELAARFPQSRLVRRAQNRADFLATNLAAGAEPLRLYQAILADAAARPHAEALTRMAELVRRYPTFPLVPHALFWMGTLYQADERWDEAIATYERVLDRHGDSEWAPRAQVAIGDIWLSRGEFDRARLAYQGLERFGGSWIATAEQARKRLAAAARLPKIELGCVVLFCGILLGYGLRAFRRGERPTVPLELKFYVPVATAFVLAASTEHRAILRASLILASAGALLIFLVGQQRASLRTRFLHLFAVAAAVGAVFFLAIESQHLTDLVVETFRYGAEP